MKPPHYKVRGKSSKNGWSGWLVQLERKLTESERDVSVLSVQFHFYWTSVLAHEMKNAGTSVLTH